MPGTHYVITSGMVPAVDGELNDIASNVIGNKADTAITAKDDVSCVIRYEKGIVEALGGSVGVGAEVQTTTVASAGGSVATTTRLGLLVRWIADAINSATSGLAALKAILDTSGVILNAKTAAFKLLAGNQQTFTKQITSAANAGAVTVATITTQACKIKSIVVRSNGATTADLTSIAITGGASAVVTFIDSTTGLRANIAAADQQVSWSGRATLAATKTIVITLAGTGATAVDLQVDIEYEAIVDAGVLV
ncbi:MAG: hypothetical protein Q8O55_08035 [Dehalococcoidales bacterium]|nr:hypothetical protein [Dehalococcoidales bacterium]